MPSLHSAALAPTRRLAATSVRLAAGVLCLSVAAAASAQSGAGWQWGAVLDVTHSTHTLAEGGRDRGLQLGHSDLMASGPLGSQLKAQLSAVFATHEGSLEKSFEEAWVETTRLPAGLQLRAGRFASQIGYLNQQHPHADDFVERPLLYRSFLGGHWNDDGLRLNWTAPTPFYLMLGAEAFGGKRLVDQAQEAAPRVGARTVSIKLGADFDRSNSWQLGWSQLYNRRQAVVEDHADEEGAHAAHQHHGARLSGRRMSLLDLTWKWAPDGDGRNRQLRLGLEAAQISGIAGADDPGARHGAQALALVWRWHSQWEVGARLDALRARVVHEGELERARLQERSLMLAYKPSHLQTLRLQYTTQLKAQGFDNPVRHALQLQYVLGFGAHPAHAY
ncbi:MAG: hypothetical protein WCK08_20410 [Betaproteobacteria bacterium]